MSFGFFRTIWISIRAANYTQRAFNDTLKGIDKMRRDQMEFAASAAKNIMAVGTLYLAFGGIAVKAITSVINASRSGERMMDMFGRRMDKVMSRLGDALTKIVAPILNIVASLLETATAIPYFNELAAAAVVFGTGVLFLVGATKLLTGAIGFLTVVFLHKLTLLEFGRIAQLQYIIDTKFATIATYGWANAIKTVAGSFTIVLGVLLALNNPILSAIALIVGLTVVLWKLFVAESAVTVGMALVAGGAAAAGAVALASQMSNQEFQMGTSFVSKGGLATVHAGEEIISARETTPTSRMGRGDKGQSSFPTTINRITLNLNGNLETKADNETLMPMIGRELNKILKNKV